MANWNPVQNEERNQYALMMREGEDSFSQTNGRAVRFRPFFLEEKNGSHGRSVYGPKVAAFGSLRVWSRGANTSMMLGSSLHVKAAARDSANVRYTKQSKAEATFALEARQREM